LFIQKDNYRTLVQCFVDIIVFLELSDEDNFDEDDYIQTLENISYKLKLLSDEEKKILASEFILYSEKYEGEKKEIILNLPNNLGFLES
jgi:hypothetical protein